MLKEKETNTGKSHATAILLILFTGLRIGETMGLRWEDIDFSDGTINIERIRLMVPNDGVIEDTPKTEGSVRMITVPDFVMEMLKDLQVYQRNNKIILGDEYTDSGYVFTVAEGTPHHPHNTYHWFKRFLKRYGLRDTTLHDLRHTCCDSFIYRCSNCRCLKKTRSHKYQNYTGNLRILFQKF